MSRYNNKAEYETDIEEDQFEVDPDLVEVRSVNGVDKAKIEADPSANDPRRMIKYHLNWWGLPFSLGIIYYYGSLIFHQMSGKLPSMLEDLLPISIAFKIRYIGAFIYFVACLISRQYVFECRNAEGPLLVATVLELYYLLNNKEGEPAPTIFQLAKPVTIAAVCFMRRKPFWKIAMNPWSKDKSEMHKFIQDAKSKLGITELM